ncbi:hypothetical protein GGS23DRAFT_565222 [Durotheca rogersii]|uniref:uncharacterized protein n=1 Tax=Durotheca rogersii TaxID=419775 RepID=UPI00221F2292|nr:uncharacterized protein GGS23DRAFT_565222 [Durotheca rogersii]KAI5863756.1 hypothetical protein GGS23DRAFT_565222 [Durotheca rogersii]
MGNQQSIQTDEEKDAADGSPARDPLPDIKNNQSSPPQSPSADRLKTPVSANQEHSLKSGNRGVSPLSSPAARSHAQNDVEIPASPDHVGAVSNLPRSKKRRSGNRPVLIPQSPEHAELDIPASAVDPHATQGTPLGTNEPLAIDDARSAHEEQPGGKGKKKKGKKTARRSRKKARHEAAIKSEDPPTPPLNESHSTPPTDLVISPVDGDPPSGESSRKRRRTSISERRNRLGSDDNLETSAIVLDSQGVDDEPSTALGKNRKASGSSKHSKKRKHVHGEDSAADSITSFSGLAESLYASRKKKRLSAARTADSIGDGTTQIRGHSPSSTHQEPAPLHASAPSLNEGDDGRAFF